MPPPLAALAAPVAVLVTETREFRWREAEHARVQRRAIAAAGQPALSAEALHVGEAGQRQQAAPHRGLQRAYGGRRERAGAREEVRGGERVVPPQRGGGEAPLQGGGKGRYQRGCLSQARPERLSSRPCLGYCWARVRALCGIPAR